MQLSAYVLSIIRDATTYTADSISVDGTLCQRFHAVMRRSDDEVREYGYNLRWSPARRVERLPTLYQGSANGTAVDLQTGATSNTFDYIGDFHTHPYRQKYGDGIGVGPSNGDWLQWFRTPPQHKPLAVHFVASGDQLYMLILRNIPNGDPNFGRSTSDAGRLNDLIRNNDALALAYGEALQARDWGGMRAALQQHAPRAMRIHADDTEAMNKELSNAHGHEYYRGTLRAGSAHLTLRSNRAVGNWLSSRFWSRGSKAWF